jgi:hypothetical protein
MRQGQAVRAETPAAKQQYADREHDHYHPRCEVEPRGLVQPAQIGEMFDGPKANVNEGKGNDNLYNGGNAAG